MKKIWRYTLEASIDQRLEILIPSDHKILTVQAMIRDRSVSIWALVDESTPQVPVVIRTIFTGQPIPDNPGEYIGTFQADGGNVVVHVFKELEPRILT